nr:nucleobase-ascorbate transporter 11 [Quercus suber]
MAPSSCLRDHAEIASSSSGSDHHLRSHRRLDRNLVLRKMKKNTKMEAGSSSQFPNKPERVKGASISSRLGSMFPKIEPFVPRIDHDPNDLRSWAKRPGFVSDYSRETKASASASDKNDSAGFDLERGFDHRNGGGSSPKIEIDPILGRTRPNQGIEIEPQNQGAALSISFVLL